MKLKGLLVRRKSETEVEVLPLFHGKKGSTIKGTGMKQTGKTVKEAVELLLPILLGRGDLKG